MGSSSATAVRRVSRLSFLLLLGVLVLVVGFLFRDSFKTGMAMFANDGPLGLIKSRVYETPGSFTGVWIDLNWLGGDGGNLSPNFSSLLFWLLGPFGTNKFHPAIAVIVLGCSAWVFFRVLGFGGVACALGGIAAALNSDFFSYACWGLSSLTLCVASVFLALAALSAGRLPVWLRLVLAGGALGHALMEGFDNGAIFSLYVAAFAVFASLAARAGEAAGGGGRRLVRGALWTAGVALVAALVASQILISLVKVNIAGAVGMGQDSESKAARWNFATQWSLPPRETLRAVIPGLYGYRMDTPDGGEYWGSVGMDPAWDAFWDSASRDPERRPRAILRYSGAGHYAGVLVVLVAAFAVAQSLSKGGGRLTPLERRWVWFWGGTAAVSLLLAFGRFAPLYQIIYALPYFSTIRNPVKFLHPFNVSLVVLFAYGVEALWRGWVKASVARSGGPAGAIRAWLSRAGTWERRWAWATLALVAGAALAWLIYGSARPALVRHLGEVGFEPERAAAIARFSQGEVGLFAVVLAGAVLLVLLLLSGWFSGPRLRWAGWAAGAWLVLDLARANVPWIIHYDWRERYATNPVFDVLRAAPHEGRVTGQLGFQAGGQAGQLQQSLSQVYGVEWLQYQFRFFDIQSLDIVQMPRTPADYAAYKQALAGNPLREWELSNTRWFLTLAPFVDPLNQQLDPVAKRFRLHTAFSLSQTPSGVIQAETNATGPFGLIEFQGALPRAMLLDRWRSALPDEEILTLLASTNFNPRLELLVSEQIPAPAVETVTQPAGRVEYVRYSPKRFTLATEARTPCVLAVNDRHDPNWKVYVDGKEEPLLRVNYIGRGVYLTPGSHRVEFRFEPPVGWLVVSWGSLAGCGVLAGYGVVSARRRGVQAASGSGV